MLSLVPRKGKSVTPNSHNVTKNGLPPILPLDEFIYEDIPYKVDFVNMDGTLLYECSGEGFDNCYQKIVDIDQLKDFKFLSLRISTGEGHIRIIMRPRSSVISALNSGTNTLVPNAIQVDPRVAVTVSQTDWTDWRYQYCPVSLDVNHHWTPLILNDRCTFHSMERTRSCVLLCFTKAADNLHDILD